MSIHPAHRAPALIQEFASRLREFCRAEGVAVLLHTEPLDRKSLLLVTSGERFAPELKDPDTAWRFLIGHRASCAGEAGRPEDGLGIRRVRSAAADSALLRLVRGNLWLAVTGARATDRPGWLAGHGCVGGAPHGSGDGLPGDGDPLAGALFLSARLAWQVYHLSQSLRETVCQLTDIREPLAAGRKPPLPDVPGIAPHPPGAHQHWQGSEVDPMTALSAELAWQVEQALSDSPRHPVPVGRWLHDDLVLAISTACGNVARRAARVAGVPESTYRRQLEKARSEAEMGLAVRSPSWASTREILDRLVACSMEGAEVDLLDGIRSRLLRIVVDRVGEEVAVGAALMGVTTPTFKRWMRRAAA